MNKNDRYVVNHPDGWAVKKSYADRASAIFTIPPSRASVSTSVAGAQPWRNLKYRIVADSTNVVPFAAISGMSRSITP
jgi:hypothetical protein